MCINYPQGANSPRRNSANFILSFYFILSCCFSSGKNIKIFPLEAGSVALPLNKRCYKCWQQSACSLPAPQALAELLGSWAPPADTEQAAAWHILTIGFSLTPLLWFLLEAHPNTCISLLLRYTAEGAKPPGNKNPSPHHWAKRCNLVSSLPSKLWSFSTETPLWCGPLFQPKPLLNTWLISRSTYAVHLTASLGFFHFPGIFFKRIFFCTISFYQQVSSYIPDINTGISRTAATFRIFVFCAHSNSSSSPHYLPTWHGARL